MSEYNRQQTETILRVRQRLGAALRERLRQAAGPYLEFRAAVAGFQRTHLLEHCARQCFSRGVSACCGREGIITFFADVVINLLLSSDEEIDSLLTAIAQDPGGDGCVYLGDAGCLWRLKPIVCEMFLCERAKGVLSADTSLEARWEGLREREKRFTFPDRPVLFDDVERHFLDEGLESPLMYFHRSPGLLRLKKRHGVGGRPPGGSPGGN